MHSDSAAPDWDPAGHFTWQEGNAVQGPDGTMYNILRIDGQTMKTNNKAAILRVTSSTNNRPGAFELKFDRMIDFPSTTSKFVIRRSNSNGLYYTLATDVTSVAVAQGTVYARNHLVLAYSADLFNWTTCLTLLGDDTGLSSVDSARYTGFHYVDWIFDGIDIVYAVRTGYRGSNTYHNANRLTTKRLASYAQACESGKLWRNRFVEVGQGWCRPTAGYLPSMVRAGSDRDCAQSCEKWSECRGFARQQSSCALYPESPTGSSAAGNITCYQRLQYGNPDL